MRLLNKVGISNVEEPKCKRQFEENFDIFKWCPLLTELKPWNAQF